eukprot:gene6730-13627_t
MEMSPDQCCDVLCTMFVDLNREYIASILKRHNYQIERTIDDILETKNHEVITQLESAALLTKSCPKHEEIIDSYILKTEDMTNNNIKVSVVAYRGAKITLPNSFLRVPGWQTKHEEAITKRDFMTLFADPIFLREVEREFGPDYEQVLRDHLRAIQQNLAKELEQKTLLENSISSSSFTGSRLSVLDAAANSGASSFGTGLATEPTLSQSHWDTTSLVDEGLLSIQMRFQELLDRFSFTSDADEDHRQESEPFLDNKESNASMGRVVECEDDHSDTSQPLLVRYGTCCKNTGHPLRSNEHQYEAE